MAKRSRPSRHVAAAAPAVVAPPRWERARWMAVCAGAGVIWFLSCADFDVWPLAWVAMVPTLFAIERASTLRRAILFAWITGIVANAGGFYWINNLLVRFAHLSWPVAIFGFTLMCAYQGLTFALFAWIARRIRERTRLPMTLVAPLVMVACELAMPMLFPWYLAITQAWQLHVIQIADLTGPLGVTALLLLVNGAIYDLATARRVRPALAAAAILAGALLYGHLRIGQVAARAQAAPHIQVGIVQGNVPFNEKGYEHPELGAQQLATLKKKSVELEAAGADLILWTETALPYALPRSLKREPPMGIRSNRVNGELVPLFRTPLIFGALTYAVDERGRDVDQDPYNTAIMLDPDGNFTGRFDKTFLVMFSEQIPLVRTFPWLRKVLPRNSGNLTPGEGVEIFRFRARDGREVRAAPMICFEDIIAAFSVKVGRKHPELLVNITNDAWFGDTSEPWEHLALSVFRAVEVRSSLVRAVNTGVSAVVDPTGAVTHKTYVVDPHIEPRPADTLLAPVPLLEGGHTVYVQIGDVFGYACAAASLFLWLVLPRLRRSGQSTA
jgi:apolipoprotein N-acyltransferase